MQLKKLNDISTITMGQSPKGETYNNENIGLPLLNGPTEFGSTHPTVSLYTTDSKRKCEKGDLIFCVRGSTTGKMNWADKVYSLGRGVCSFRGNTLGETKYIRYCLEVTMRSLLQMAGGGTFPNLTKETIENFEIPYKDNREEIASILSTYDDLIENNNRRIAILEEMARSLYKEWFVKFRFPGHEEVKMIDSELGQIPNGWRIAQISDIYKTSSGGTPSRLKPEYYNGEIQWIKTKELRDGFVVECEETISKLGLIKSSAKLFPKYTVLMAMYGATIGQLGIISKESASNQACCAIIAIDEIFSPWYIYLNLLSNRTYIIGQRMGAAQQNISQQIIKDLKIIQPDSQTMQKFNQIVEPIFFKIENLQKKNNNLKTQRDILLPKLISGKYRSF